MKKVATDILIFVVAIIALCLGCYAYQQQISSVKVPTNVQTGDKRTAINVKGELVFCSDYPYMEIHYYDDMLIGLQCMAKEMQYNTKNLIVDRKLFEHSAWMVAKITTGFPVIKKWYSKEDFYKFVSTYVWIAKVWIKAYTLYELMSVAVGEPLINSEYLGLTFYNNYEYLLKSDGRYDWIAPSEEPVNFREDDVHQLISEIKQQIKYFEKNPKKLSTQYFDDYILLLISFDDSVDFILGNDDDLRQDIVNFYKKHRKTNNIFEFMQIIEKELD